MTSLAVLAGLPTGSAWAAGSVTGVSPNLVLNTSSRTLTFTTTDTLLGPPTPAPTVTLTRYGTSGASADTISPTSVSAIPLGPGTTSLTATFDFTGVNPALAYDVEIKQLAVDDTCSSCLTVNGFTPVVSGASVSGTTSTATLGLGTTKGVQPFVISGQNFAKGPYTQCSTWPCAGPTVAIVRHGQPAGTFDGNATLTPTVTFNSDGSTTDAPTNPTPTSITMRILLNGANTAAYDDDIIVTNTDGKVSTACSACLHVAPQPAVSGITQPADSNAAEIGLNAKNRTLVVSGTNFAPDAVVTLTPPTGASNPGVIHFTSSAPATVGNHQEITLTDVDTTAAAATGAWNVVVSSPSLQNRSDVAPLSPTHLAVNAAPTATNLTYDDAGSISSVGQGAQGRHVSVSGSNIVSGTVISFAGLPVAVTPSNETADAVAQKVTVTLAATQSAATGSYTATLVNPDGGTSGACTVPAVNPPLGSPTPCPLVIAAGPAPSSVSPNSVTGGYAGAFAITGTNLHTGTDNVHVTVGPSNAPYFDGLATAVANGASQTISIPAINVPNAETVKDTDVTVTNVDNGGTKTLTGVLHVANLSVTSLSRTSDTNDAPSTGITITGTNFDPNATVVLQPPAVAGSLPPLAVIPGSNVVWNSATSLTTDFDITNAAPGDYQVLVTNPSNSTHPGTAGGPVFTVQANAPTTATVAPTALGAGAKNVAVAVTGTNFFPDSVVTFDNPAITLVGNPVINGARTLITQHVNVAPDAQAGSTGVTVTNTAGQTSGPQTITLDAAPTVVGVTPANHAPGSFSISVAGTGFVSGASISFSDPGVTGTVTNVAGDGSSLTADVTVDPAVVPGDVPADIAATVTNPDFGQATSPASGDLTVDPLPRVTQLTPGSIAAGTSVPLQVFGANFLPGAVLGVPGGVGLSLSDQTFVSSGEIDATLTAAANSVQALRAVTVDNQEGGTASKDIAVFVIPDAPTGLTVTPHDSSLEVSWSPPTNDGGDAISSYTIQATPSAGGSPVSHTTANGTTLTYTVPALTNGTSYDITVLATNDAGDGPAAAASGTPRTVPSAPSLTVTPLDTELDLSWSAPADGGSPITGYTATLTPHAGGATTTQPLGPDATSYHFTGLTNGTAYDVELFASNLAGDSTHATATQTPRVVPGLPTAVSVTPGNGTLSVTWAAPASDGGNAVDHYTASVTPHAGGAVTTFSTSDATTLAHTFGSLTNGTLYDVSVTAHNAAGDGAPAAASGTPRTVPDVPTAVAVTPGDGALSVSWAAPASDGGNPIDTYTVSVAPHAGGAATTFTTPDASTLAHTFGSLTNGTLYDVSVTAHNAAGDGAAAAGSGTPARAANAPSIRAIVPGDGGLTVSWSAPTADGGAAVTSYTVTATPHAGGTATAFTTPDATTTSHAFTGLTNGAVYDVSVVANNSAGQSSPASGSATPRFASTLTIVDSATKVVYGHAVTVSGLLTRSDKQPVAGASVTLFRAYDGKASAAYRILTTDSTGHWSTTFTPAYNATYFASFAGNTAVSPATTGVARTTVAPRVVVRSPLNKSTSSSATPLKISGKVSPNKAGRAVVLYYVTKTGKLVRVTSTHLSSTSTYVLKAALKRGTWHLRVVIGASSGNVTGSSSTLTVKRT